MGSEANLALAIGMLACGPPIAWAAARWRGLTRLVDGFVMLSVGALVALHVLPEAVETAGWWAVLAGIAGLTLPLMLEQRSTGTGHGRLLLPVIAIAGLMAHALFDGVALVGAELEGEAGGHLAMAVVIHRVTVSLAVWWLVQPRRGGLAAVVLLGLVAVATLGGYLLAEPLLHSFGAFGSALFLAFMAGALLHVVAHPAQHQPEAPGRWRISENLGAALGLLVVLLVPDVGHGHGPEVAHEATFGSRFLDLALAAAPALVVGYTLAGLVAGFVPRPRLSWLERGGTLQQAARGTVAGIPLPLCSCDIVPRFRSLTSHGAPGPAAAAFLAATPELGVEALVLSFALLGPELAAIRVAAGVLIALLVGVSIGRRLRRRGDAGSEPAEASHERPPTRLASRLRAAARYGFGEVVEDTAPWVVVGLATAAVLGAGAAGTWVSRLPWGLDVVAFALAGIPMYVCSSAATPMAAVAILVGVSPGAAVAFLFAGPASNATAFGALREHYSGRIALLFASLAVVLAIGAGLAVNGLFPNLQVPMASVAGHETAPWYSWAALGALGLLFALALLRIGPRAALNTILHLGRRGPHHEHGHEHDHEHDHEHTPS